MYIKEFNLKGEDIMSSCITVKNLDGIKVKIDWDWMSDDYDCKIVAKGLFNHFIYLKQFYYGDICRNHLTWIISENGYKSVLTEDTPIVTLKKFYTEYNDNSDEFNELITILHDLAEYRDEDLELD